MPRDTTMLELLSALSALVRSGAVRLCGVFKGTRFEPSIGEPSWQPVVRGVSPSGGAR